MHSKKTAFIVEHDFIMAAYLADRVIVYEGEPAREATASAPQSLLTGGAMSNGGVVRGLLCSLPILYMGCTEWV